MKVLGIDPGPQFSAFVFIDNNKILDKNILDLEGIKNILSFYRSVIDVIAVEMVACYGMPVGKEIFETVLAIGRIIEYVSALNLKFELVYRKDIKIYHCNSMRAKDSNIRQALIDRFGAPGTKKNPGKLYGIKKDLWSALAVAVYFYETKGKPRK